MFCKYCGAPLNQGARFCIHCGKEISVQPPEPMMTQAQPTPVPPPEPMMTQAQPTPVPPPEPMMTQAQPTPVPPQEPAMTQAQPAPVQEPVMPQAPAPPQEPVMTQTPPPARPQADSAVKPAPKSPKGRYWLFGGVGTAVGALLLAVILFAAGVLSFGAAAVSTGGTGGRVEGPGFDTPEDAAKAYLNGLKSQDMDAMISAFAVETYVDHYDLEAMVQRIMSYQPTLEIRLPGNTEYNRQFNIVSRRGQIAGAILNQFMCYNAPDELGNFTPTVFKDPDEASDFIDKFEGDTADYVFADMEIGSSLSTDSLPDDLEPDELMSYLESKGFPDDLQEDTIEDLYGNFVSDVNQKNIKAQAKVFGAEEEDVANVVVIFEAGGDTWVFCPQAVRYDGKWYLQTLQGNLAILANMSVYTGGIAPIG